MEDIYEKILFSYGLKLYSTQRTRRGLICKTDKGLKELRRTNNDGATIEFESKVRQHLKSKGLLEVEVYHQTLNQDAYYSAMENNYVLSNFVATTDIALTDTIAAKKAVEVLAKIHKVSCDIEGEGKTNLGKLRSVAGKRKAELIRTKKWINHQSKYSDLDIIVIQNYEYFMERTERSEALICSESYEKAINIAAQRKNICHNNFKGDSIRCVEGIDRLYISGFEKCAFDCGISDLAGFLRRQMKEEQCGAKEIDALICAYHNVQPLADFELKAMGAMILFPAKFFKICNSFYNKRRVLVNEALTDKLRRCIAISEKEEQILKEIQLI